MTDVNDPHRDLDCDCDIASESVAAFTPRPVWNRPNLASLAVRVGTQASFFETMKRRIGSYVGPEAAPGTEPPLAGLTTRDPADPAIALLDAWAVVGDVLTFYQERIANEGYLRTAVEPFSIQSLAALVGYAPRPGVAASVHLAYAVDDPAGDVVVAIPAGCRVQSTPGPGESPQTFETSEPLFARAAWNRLRPRLSAPQQPSADTTQLFVEGVSNNLQPNDPLLLVTAGEAANALVDAVKSVVYIETVEPDYVRNWTRVVIQQRAASNAGTETATATAPTDGAESATTGPLANGGLLDRLAASPSTLPRPASPRRTNPAATLAPTSNAVAALRAALRPALARTLETAIANAVVASGPVVEVHAFRARSSPFGHNAPLDVVVDPQGNVIARRDWALRKLLASAHETEPFTIVVGSVGDARPDGAGPVRVRVQIGDHPQQSGDDTASPGQIILDDRAADETVVVDFADGDGFRFEFRKRHVIIDLRMPAGDDDTTLMAETSGCDPIRMRMSTARDREGRVGVAAVGGVRRAVTSGLTIKGRSRVSPTEFTATEAAQSVSLATVFDRVVPGSWALVQRADDPTPIVARVDGTSLESRADYGLSGPTTRLSLDTAWLGSGRTGRPGNASARDIGDEDFATVIRGSVVYAQSEKLTLAPAPVTDDVAGGSIVLDGVHLGLAAGRWVIVEGERTDIPGTSGVRGAEVAMIAAADSVVASDIPGETYHTRLTLASPLAWKYKVDSVNVFANVSHATHGESHAEVLGSGDATRASQRFTLKQAPLTRVTAVTPTGAASTLEVRVNNLLWHEAEPDAESGPTDRRYVVGRASDGATTISFGDGQRGARLPSGADNVRARYRSGLGTGGNLAPGRLDQPTSRPLGVATVTNPVASSGGADPETLEETRRHAWLGLMSFDRLVSVSDHSDFARSYAGVGRAAARKLAVARRETLHLSIAGTDESPIAASSDVCVQLRQAVLRLGDPALPVEVVPGETVLLMIAARVRVAADHLWDAVEPAVRAALVVAFGYACRDFGQDVVPSQVIAAIQGVAGVEYVDLDRLDAVADATLAADLARIVDASPTRPPGRIRALPARVVQPGDETTRTVLPAQIVFLSAKAPAMLMLQEIT